MFKNKEFAVGLAIMAATMISMIGSETVLPMFVQNLLGRTPIDSGLILLPGAIVMAIMSVISGWLYETFGAKVLAIIGMSIVLITTSYFVVMDEHTSTVMLATVYAIRMIGIAMGLMPIMTHTMNQLTPELNAHGSSMTNTIQQIAGSIGTAGLITILSTASKNFQPTMSDYQGMDKRNGRTNTNRCYASWLSFRIFICRYYYIHQFIAYILIKSKKKVKAEAKLQND